METTQTTNSIAAGPLGAWHSQASSFQISDQLESIYDQLIYPLAITYLAAKQQKQEKINKTEAKTNECRFDSGKSGMLDCDIPCFKAKQKQHMEVSMSS